MHSSKDWADHVDAWLARDLALMTERDGWHPIAAPGDIGLWRRRMPDDANDLFRWRLPVVEAPAEVVFEGFVHRILEHHKVWTRDRAPRRTARSTPTGWSDGRG